MLLIIPQAKAGSPRPLLLLLILLLQLSGCVTAGEREEREQARAIERGVTILAARRDADSLAAAGVLLLGTKSKYGLSLLARAVEAAPERADLLWIQAQACHITNVCDPEPVEVRLRLVDASNGAGWMARLTRADAAQDEQGIDDALIAMGRSKRVNIFWTSLLARLSVAAARDTKIPLQVALTKVSDRMAFATIPSYSPISNACKGERLNRTEVVEACRAVAAAMMRGDSIITEMMGIAIAKRVWPSDSEEWKAADDARLRMNQLMKSYETDSRDDAATAARDVLLLGQYPREQDYFRARMLARGVDPDQPTPAE